MLQFRKMRISRSVSSVETCQSLKSPIFTCASPTNNDSSTILSPITLTQEDSQKEYEEMVKQKDELRITGGTEKTWTSRTKRRVHNEEVFCLNIDLLKKNSY